MLHGVEAFPEVLDRKVVFEVQVRFGVLDAADQKHVGERCGDHNVLSDEIERVKKA